MTRDDVLLRTVFTIDDEPYTWADVVDAATAWGEWPPVPNGPAAPPDDARAAVERLATAFRRQRGLLSADETAAWFRRWGVTVSEWLAHLRCEALGEPPADPDDARWIKAVTSGVLERSAHRLAGALAAHRALGGAGRPHFPGLDTAVEDFAERSATPERVAAVIAANRLAWTALDVAPADGPGEPRRTTLDQAGAELGRLLVGAAAGDVVGPVTVDGVPQMLHVRARTEPTAGDPDIAARARAEVAAAALRREVASRVRWAEHVADPSAPPADEIPQQEDDGAGFGRSGRRIRRFPTVLGVDEMDCGAACLAAVCRHFGRSVPLPTVRDAVAMAVDGTSLAGLTSGAQRLGLSARALKASPSRLGSTGGAEHALRGLMRRQFDALADTVYRSDLAFMRYDAAVQLVAFVTLALVLWAGGLSVLGGDLSIGELVAFNGLVVPANGPVGTLLRLWDELQYASVLLGRLDDVLAQEPEQGRDHSGLHPVPQLSGRVSVEHLTLRTDGPVPATILDDVSIDVEPGQTIALVGRSGAGKTTLVRCLAGLQPATSGRILYDGVDLDTLDHRELRRRIGFVLQDDHLFDGTLTANIILGDEEVDPERVRWAARVADAADFIERLPLGYDTRIGETGLRLSGGQAQRVAIARAVYRRPSILILDEATSSLDAESERAVRHGIDELLAGRTALVIAHRLSTVREADRIVVLDGGRVVEQGTHDELMARRSLYWYLAGQQLDG